MFFNDQFRYRLDKIIVLLYKQVKFYLKIMLSLKTIIVHGHKRQSCSHFKVNLKFGHFTSAKKFREKRNIVQCCCLLFSLTFPLRSPSQGAFHLLELTGQDHSSHNENFTFNKNNPVRSVRSQIACTITLGKSSYHYQNDWSGRSVLTFGKRPQFRKVSLKNTFYG